jgi:putative ABC transport system ATP-binding protein
MSLLNLKEIKLALGKNEARVEILKNISLSFKPAQTVGILGASGSGKSTLLMVLAGLEKPDSGQVLYQGQDLTKLSEDALAKMRAKHIGIVFQSFHLLPALTALENVALPLELQGVKQASKRALAELAAVGLANRAAHYPAQLSGGEQQRVAIARAFVSRPSLILADEPTGNLDETTGASITQLMFKRVQETNATLIMITHDAALAAQCQRRIHLKNGQVESDSEAKA